MINKTKLLLFLVSLFSIYYFSMLTEEVTFVFMGLTFLLLLYFYLMLAIDDEIINPLSLLFPFVLSVYYYQFMFSRRQTELVFDASASILLFIVFYTITVISILFFKKSIISKTSRPHKVESTLLMDFVFYFGVFIFLVECALTGGFPFFVALIQKVNIYEDMRYIPILHYLVMLIAIFPAIYYYLYKNQRVGPFKFVSVCAISLFVLLNIMSRQIFILAIIFMFFSYAKVNRINTNRFVLKGVLSATFLFFLLGFIRIKSIKDSVTQLDYLKAYARIPKERDVNTFDVTFNLYTSQNIATFNDIVTKASEFGMGLGKYTLQSFNKTFMYHRGFDIEYRPEMDSFTRLGTILTDPYLDFGLIGVIIFGILYGIINTFTFLKAKHSDSIRYTFFWATLCFIMIMSVFTNFYNVLFSWLVFLFIFFITSKVKAH